MPQGPWQRVGTVERVAATGLEIYQVRLENLPVRLTPPCWTHCPHSCHALWSDEAGILKPNERSEAFSSPFSCPAHCPGAPSISVKLPLQYIVLLDFQLPVNDRIPF